MTSSGKGYACDTSFAVAALDPSHEAHAACRAELIARRPALAGHAAFETYSVLTRLPVPLRLTASQADAVLRAAFPDGCWLSAAAAASLHGGLADLGVVGGAVYDALVGAAARADGRVLLTRDRRAVRTYRSIDVEHRLVE